MEISILSPLAGWLLPLDEVADPVFAQRLLGDGMAIDPLAGILHAPAAGTIRSIHQAGHSVTLVTAEGAELLMHIGLDTVALQGAGFAPQVVAGQQVLAGEVLIRFDLAALGSRVRSLVTPLICANPDRFAVADRRQPQLLQPGDPLMTLRPAGVRITSGTVSASAPELRCTVRIPLAHGLHARPSAQLAAALKGLVAAASIHHGGHRANLRSPTGILGLGIRHGDTIELRAQGADAAEALDRVAALIESGMGESLPFADDGVLTAPQSPHGTPEAGLAVEDDQLPPAGLTGVTAAAGLAIGPAFRLRVAQVAIAPAMADDVAGEQACLVRALNELQTRLGTASANATPAQAAILQAHAAFLEDADLLDEAEAGIATGISAGAAWHNVLLARSKVLRASPDRRLAERADDLLDLDQQIQSLLTGEEPASVEVPEGAVLIADDLLPSQVAALDPQRVAGLAIAGGGPTSHAAIIAASRGVPAVMALGPGLQRIDDGTPLILDADAAVLEVAPSPARLQQARLQLERAADRAARAQAAAGQEGRTADGVRIEMFVNLGSLADVAPALAGGAEGCGLLRTEFLFLDRTTAPDEAEQAADYSAIAQAMEGRPVIVRLLDIGGDKPAPYLPIAAEENPALGLRGIRVGLARPAVLATQLRAILRANSHGTLRIMVPMVARVEELRQVRRALDAAADEIGTGAQLGVMVETPAAAMIADLLAAECDFLSIGTNDLTQYTLAMDRGNAAVAGGIDGLDPAVLRLVERCCAGAAVHGRPVGVCGGLASDRVAIPLLLGLGVTELSVTPAALALAKADVRALSHARCRGLAQHALALDGPAAVRAAARAALEDWGL
ncbi:phosphoenolpyruvate--protein phosphotransferase [Croceibacterium ferulae]|uniref:phosphoenolpyruvate--protein phosphotransferase n=1 Tax=Croceibacterium ferulae TaxID=1854641 RepID=UPI000EAC2D05|nr:phosphoenolpyruvate--protein phosphotransferase [Croceibacterium ferulae]